MDTETNEQPQPTAVRAEGTSSVPKKRVRLPKPSKVLARVLQRLERCIVEHESGKATLKHATVVNILLTQSRVALALHRDQTSRENRLAQEAKRALKSAAQDAAQTPVEKDPDVVRMAADWLR